MEPLKPQLKKLNPIEGAKNMLKMRTVIELIKNVLKMAAILILAFLAIKRYLRPFLLTTTVPIEEGIKIGGMILFYFLTLVFIIFILIAFADIMLQKKEHKKNLKMTKDEVKREYKEDEGDPMIKGQRKQLHQEMAMSDVAQQVAKSDVVLTNPTHIAVAVKYDAKEMVAPEIMAKGQRLYAQYIRELAEQYDVPIMRNIPLAWALIELDVGDEIPEDLYQAVAEILAFVYRLKAEKEYASVQPRA
jgi:flagellar biosynthetic protein FlhB